MDNVYASSGLSFYTMKVLIAGGHMGPALAVIAALPKDTEIVYVGRKYTFEGDAAFSLEYQTVRKMGIPFISLTAGRIQRVITPHTVSALLKIPLGLWKAILVLKKEKPDVVVGFGGYISWPLGIAAKICCLPLIIHEQTLHAGMANKILAPFADKICISWEESSAYFPKNKTVLTGNPLLPFTKNVTRRFPSGKLPLLVIVGGSAGSHAINSLVVEALPSLLKSFRILHQTGDTSEFRDFERLERAKALLPKEIQSCYEIIKFISPQDMWGVLDRADGVVSRSGMNTITMLLVLQKRSLLIPFPYGQKNEQLENALLYEKRGLGRILEQEKATAGSFVQAITAMMNMHNADDRQAKVDATLHLHAASAIAEIIRICSQEVFKKEKTV